MSFRNRWSYDEPLMYSSRDSRSLFSSKYSWIISVALVTIFLWRFRYGELILYPFTLVSTFVHELGHGLTAKLVGFQFSSLLMETDGSGMAVFYYPEDASRFALAFVSFMGPMNGPFMGSIFIILRSFNLTKQIIYFFIIALTLTGILYIGNFFGFIFIIAMIALLIIVLQTKEIFQIFFVDMLGTQIAIGIYHDLEYLFTYEVEGMNGKMMLSDTGSIQQVLILPHWFWATFMLCIATFMLISSLILSFNRSKDDSID